jgi:hypothetical protein
MRRKSLLNLIFGLVLFAGIGVSDAQTLTLMDWTNQWRYLITNSLPTGWSASNYPAASGWPQTNGVLTTPAEQLPAGVAPTNGILTTTFNTTYVTSFYFRTSLTLTSNPNSLSITGMAVIDDGAVIYINGREITPRFAMPTGTILPTTLATRADDVSAHGIETFAIASSNFVQGVNQIAVEVHQGSTNSSDVVWGLKVVATVNQPPSITTQPQDQTVDAGARATFSVVATGTAPLTYRWYSNNVLIVTGSSPSYQTPVTTIAMDGTKYYVTVSNRFGLVQSSNAFLHVQQDINGPLMVTASALSTNQILVTFNETVLRSAAISNFNNFAVHIFGTSNDLPVTNVSYGATQLRLGVDGILDSGSNYIVCVYNLEDLKTNSTPENCIGMTGLPITQTNFALGSQWHFTDMIIDDTLCRTNWTAINFDDSEFANPPWGFGNGLFYFDRSAGFPGLSPCSPPGTEMVKGARTQYFRKKFTVAAIPATNVSVNLRLAIDDGAVFYINGTEIGRYQMPATAVCYDTRAAAATVDATTCVPQVFNNIPTTLFNIGANNVIAVEVHQEEADPAGLDGDTAFDLELSLSYRRTPAVPDLNVRKSGSNFVFTWTSSGYFLESSTNISGPTWTRVTSNPGQTNFTTGVPSVRTNRFYRLKNP